MLTFYCCNKTWITFNNVFQLTPKSLNSIKFWNEKQLMEKDVKFLSKWAKDSTPFRKSQYVFQKGTTVAIKKANRERSRIHSNNNIHVVSIALIVVNWLIWSNKNMRKAYFWWGRENSKLIKWEMLKDYGKIQLIKVELCPMWTGYVRFRLIFWRQERMSSGKILPKIKEKSQLVCNH